MAEIKSSFEPDYFSVDSCPYGLSYGEWTVEWWRWFLSASKSKNPALDTTGEYADLNQPPRYVWFLAGKLADEDRDLPNRQCGIPVGRSILFPVISCEANALEFPELKTEQEVIDHVRADENTIVEKVCLLNDKPVPVQRVQSDPAIFQVKLSEDNVYNVRGENTTAYGDGYWVFLKPLPQGDYILSFRGSCENGRLRSGANYKLKIQNN
jgi:hypothetical protein